MYGILQHKVTVYAGWCKIHASVVNVKKGQKAALHARSDVPTATGVGFFCCECQKGSKKQPCMQGQMCQQWRYNFERN